MVKSGDNFRFSWPINLRIDNLDPEVFFTILIGRGSEGADWTGSDHRTAD